MTKCNDDFDSMSSSEFSACPLNSSSGRILMVLTEIDMLDEIHKTGVWFEEFAVPYLRLVEEGYDVTVATLHGKPAPIDPRSTNFIDDMKWHEAKLALESPVALPVVNVDSYDAIIFPGGHGPMVDLAKSDELGKLVAEFFIQHKLIAAICHGPAALLRAKKNGDSIFKGLNITSFTNEEERLAKLDAIVPFLLESRLVELGAEFTHDKAGEVFVVVDKNIITAQNHQSVGAFTETILEYLKA